MAVQVRSKNCQELRLTPDGKNTEGSEYSVGDFEKPLP